MILYLQIYPHRGGSILLMLHANASLPCSLPSCIDGRERRVLFRLCFCSSPTPGRFGGNLSRRIFAGIIADAVCVGVTPHKHFDRERLDVLMSCGDHPEVCTVHNPGKIAQYE